MDKSGSNVSKKKNPRSFRKSRSLKVKFWSLLGKEAIPEEDTLQNPLWGYLKIVKQVLLPQTTHPTTEWRAGQRSQSCSTKTVWWFSPSRYPPQRNYQLKLTGCVSSSWTPRKCCLTALSLCLVHLHAPSSSVLPPSWISADRAHLSPGIWRYTYHRLWTNLTPAEFSSPKSCISLSGWKFLASYAGRLNSSWQCKMHFCRSLKGNWGVEGRVNSKLKTQKWDQGHQS